MNGPLERAMRVAGTLVPVFSLVFVAALLGPLPALLASIVLGAAATWLWLHFDLPSRRPWLPPLALTLTVLAAVATVEITLHASFAGWFAPVLTAVAAALTLWLLLRSRAQCNLCGRRLGSQSLVFRCPRCSQQVCDETCWSFDHRRCQLCLEQRVPVLPIQDSWWLRVTGPRARQGRCQVCLGTADQLDLRACPHCRRPQCRDCWDFNNAECARCGKALPELPAGLTTAVAHVTESPPTFSR